MSRSLAYSLAFMASTCFAHLAVGQAPTSPTSSRATAADSTPVKVSFNGDTSRAGSPVARTSWQTSEFKTLPASGTHQKPAVVLPASARMNASQSCTSSPNWTDSCSHCGTSGCDGYGCGFGDYANEPTKFAPGGLWVKAEYLYWRVSGNNLPPLVTSTPDGTARADVGVLPNAQVLFGNEPLSDDFRSGFRFQTGLWLDDCEKWGIQGDFAYLGENNNDFFVSSEGVPQLARPFFNSDPNVDGEDARLIAFDQTNGDDALSGFVDIDTSSEFYTGGLVLRKRIAQGYNSRWDFLVGYKHLSLDESLTINDQSTVDDASEGVVGSTIAIRDAFSADNEFHGVDLGVSGSWDMGNWALEGTVKCGLGNNQQTVLIDGSTTTTVTGNPPTTTGTGLLTQTTNIGRYERNEFAIVPEARATASYYLTDHIRITGGYNMIFVDTVTRPGDQIDRNVNGTLLQGPFAGPLRPGFQFNDSKVFIHGGNVSLDVMF